CTAFSSTPPITCTSFVIDHAVAPSGNFKAVSAGPYHACGVRSADSVVCWGTDAYGDTNAPPGSFKSVSAGWRHTCGIKADDSVVCWGDDSDFQTDAPS